MYLDFFGILPAVFYVIVGGAWSDTVGRRKPLIFLPLLGGCITNLAFLLISLFEESVPLEIFFLTKMWDLCGGMPLYYLGICSYAASNSSKINRYVSYSSNNNTDCQKSKNLGRQVWLDWMESNKLL